MVQSQVAGQREVTVDGPLTAPQVVPNLLERALITPADVVDGDLRVRATARRNLSFQVRGGAAAHLVKQAGGPDRAAGIANEAAIYRRLAAAGEPRFLPRLYHYDPAQALLVLELLPDAASFGPTPQRGRVSPALAAEVGRALAWLHRLPLPAVEPGVVPLTCSPPWVLMLAHPDLDFYRESSAANLQLMRVVRQFPTVGQRLDEIAAAWQPTRLVHADLKWDNLLVVRAGRGRPRLKIVDWEMAGRGDPCWDAGAMLGEYLSCWATSIPANGEGPPDTLLALARYPLDRMQPAIRAFWQAYTAGLGLDPPTAATWRGRAVRYAAVRLIQTAYEEGQMQLWLTNQVLLLLQLAANILERPDEAAVYLLGLGPEAGP